MTQISQTGAVESFYETHPISEKQIRDRLKAEGADLDHLTEDILQSHDQDHFGGAGANDILAACAGIGEGSSVLDVCCGLGGPSSVAALAARRAISRITTIAASPASISPKAASRAPES